MCICLGILWLQLLEMWLYMYMCMCVMCCCFCTADDWTAFPKTLQEIYHVLCKHTALCTTPLPAAMTSSPPLVSLSPLTLSLYLFPAFQLMFGVCVMFALLVPSKIISLVFPGFLPFNLTLARSI